MEYHGHESLKTIPQRQPAVPNTQQSAVFASFYSPKMVALFIFFLFITDTYERYTAAG
jgi:hypothetical protein